MRTLILSILLITGACSNHQNDAQHAINQNGFTNTTKIGIQYILEELEEEFVTFSPETSFFTNEVLVEEPIHYRTKNNSTIISVYTFINQQEALNEFEKIKSQLSINHDFSVNGAELLIVSSKDIYLKNKILSMFAGEE